ncbi:MAG TPA: glucans biosynthesis glucosyltransferase MdoH [Candidatus Methylacidiphilales bacterium]|nr:glucans biosynthesis glucosyltransferase MdoH [Candidatus Methylacidiphilales bacterium]
MSVSPPDITVAMRRTLFMGGSILLTATGFALLLHSYSGQPIFWPDYIVLALFPLLFGQIALGFLLALFGFYDWLRGGDPFHLLRQPWRGKEDVVLLAATAIVIPVFNEEVERVGRGIENMWHSLKKTGQLGHFDFYLCSDSNDPDHWIEEECAWLHLCQKLNAFGKIFYRKRRHAINGKSGNVADFCRRWGKRYRYMVILDADSVMSGPTMVRLVRAMEANPEVGILQTQPSMVLGQSFFRRILQFSNSIYGKIFSQGCSFVQMSSGSYWGHNAVIRIAPFIEHCDLPMLPVPDPRRRHVLSHDTVEAALMQKAGYEVWVAYDERGTYEEGPPNMSDMLKRDRRWCAGNLQHFWFLFARGIEMGNRLQIWIGLMAYLCSPIWLTFLIAGSIGAYDRARFLAFSAGPEDLGVAQSSEAPFLFIITVALLFLPRLLGIISSLPQTKRPGDCLRLFVSSLAETAASILIAPVLMLFHTCFVFQALFGWQIKWTTQNRTDLDLTLSHCLKLYGWQSGLGMTGQILAWSYLGFNSFWLTPIFVAWILAPLTAWITSWRGLGQTLRACGFFVIPEESQLPAELDGLAGDGEDEARPGAPLWPQALLSPYVQAVHLSMVRQRSSLRRTAKPASSLAHLRERLIRHGAASLERKDILRLLGDAETVFWLHRELWSRPDTGLHSSWQFLQSSSGTNLLLRQYLLTEEKSAHI